MTTNQRLLNAEAQLQALSQAWLHLATASEIAGSHNPQQLDASLRQMRWQQPEMNKTAQAFLGSLLDELATARSRREPAQ